MSNKLLQMVNERLQANGKKAIDATETTPTAQPARPVQYLPGGLDVYALNLDQPAAPPMGEVEAHRRQRLAAAAFETAQGLTAKERHEAARARQQAAGLYQNR